MYCLLSTVWTICICKVGQNQKNLHKLGLMKIQCLQSGLVFSRYAFVKCCSYSKEAGSARTKIYMKYLVFHYVWRDIKQSSDTMILRCKKNWGLKVLNQKKGNRTRSGILVPFQSKWHFSFVLRGLSAAFQTLIWQKFASLIHFYK